MPATLAGNTPDSLRKLVEGVEQLPSAPASATRILDLATRNIPDLNELIEAVETDQAVSLRLLRLANSAGFNRAEKVTDIRQAAMLLGTEAVCTSALCVSVREGLFGSFDAGDPLVREFWRHGLACACMARMLAQRTRPALAGTAFAAGLLHDCGKLALLAVSPDVYSRFLADEFLAGARLVRVEQEALGADHCLAGKWLLERWNLPESLVETVWMHHQPLSAFQGAGDAATVNLLVALADRLTLETMGVAPAGSKEAESLGAAAVLGLDGQALGEARAGLGAHFAEQAGLFDLREDAGSFYFNALGRANRRLGEANLGHASRSGSLERDARFLRDVALAGVDLARADSAHGVLMGLARCMSERFGSPGGLACVVDSSRQTARGVAWRDAGRPVSVNLRLDGSLAPLPKDAAGLAEGVAEHLGGCRTRATALAGPEGPPIHFQDGVAAVTVTEGLEPLGELLYRPAAGVVSPEERTAVGLLAQLAAQAFRRLELVSRCERRSERLAEVMRSMQDMNDKLLKTQRLAAVGQLAAGAAHEINNPLAIISARAQLLEMREADPAKKKGLRQMVEQIDRISAILGGLMDFARPAAPRMAAMNPRDVMDRVLSLVEGGLTGQGVRIERDYRSPIPDVMADSRQMEQVLLNLALNAQHAMEGSGGSLTARLSFDPAGDSVAFSMADTGAGIPRENLDKIFDPFFTTKAEGKGTGLGLSTAYGIVQAHRGRISVESDPGRGSVFTVVLPRDPSGRAGTGGRGDPGAERAARRAVLVVDDERHIRDILRESLESAGYEVETAEDGERALGLLRASRYRLMILDIRMPGRDGLALLREAASYLDPATPVLVLTGLASDREVAEAKTLGAAGMLRKPFQVDALLAEVSRLVSRVEVRR